MEPNQITAENGERAVTTKRKPIGWAIVLSPLLIALPIVAAFVLWGGHVAPSYRWWIEKFPWPAVAALVGVAGAITAALITFRWQDNQQRVTEGQFALQQEQFKQQTEQFKLQQDQFTEQKRQFDEKQDADQVHFESQTLDTQFTDVQTRFASADPIQRAYAAVRLTELATTRSPLWHEGPDERKYPHFPRAVSLLSTALHMEPSGDVRKHVKKAIQKLAEFDGRLKNKDGIQTLLRSLVRELADANRNAKSAFIDALAKYFALRPDVVRDEFVLDASSLPLTDLTGTCEESCWRVCIRVIVGTPACRDGIQQYARLRRTYTKIERADYDRKVFQEIRAAQTILIDSRDALTLALRQIKEPAKDIGVEDRPGSLKGERLPLENTFLAGGVLFEANLQWAVMTDAILCGARLDNAYLQNAKLEGAHLQEAILTDSYLCGATLRAASLQGADLRWASLRKARFYSAKLDGANMFQVRMTNEEDAESAIPTFKEANWWEADFSNPDGSEVDNETMATLDKIYPRPTKA
jgi:uncharacterized protein YjbI with pentapeptide repeats